MRFDAVIFDLDGTLLDSLEDIASESSNVPSKSKITASNLMVASQ